jgi:hypothetical protein
VGVQVLGTGVDGIRDTAAIGRATTFLPLVSGGADAVSAGLVFPFLMPDYRLPGGDYADPEGLIALVSTGGRLRNQLDLAAAVRSGASTVVVDPALLVGLDDVSRGRRLPDGITLNPRQREAARQFLTDLTGLARRDACWVVQYDRPDVLGITQSPEAGELTETIEQATSSTLARFQITGRRVSWPTEAGVTGPLLSAVRGTGETPVIVSATAVPDWEQRDGSLIQYAARSGPLPLLVNDAIDAGVPGETTTVTLRQRILAEAALASLQRGADPSSRADAVAVIDSRWNPGPIAGGTSLDDAFDASFVVGRTVEDLMNQRRTAYDGTVPRTARDAPIRAAQITAAADAARTARLIAMITPDGANVEARHARDIAHALGVRWREMRGPGLAAARAAAQRAERDIARVTIDGPGAVTLSSSTGSFPVTISNDTTHPVRIAVHIDSSNPALGVPDTDPVDVAAGERETITVAIDMGRQTSATLTAEMVTPDGQAFGEPAVFNVRSSRVGAALWVAIGLAAAFVVVALARRFLGHPTREARASEPLEVGPDD